MRKGNDIMWTERRHEMKKLTVILMFVVCAQVAYVGLCAELAFYHRFKETMRLVPALDSGDHVDFVGVLKDKRIKIDVTTSLESKKRFGNILRQIMLI